MVIPMYVWGARLWKPHRWMGWVLFLCQCWRTGHHISCVYYETSLFGFILWTLSSLFLFFLWLKPGWLQWECFSGIPNRIRIQPSDAIRTIFPCCNSLTFWGAVVFPTAVSVFRGIALLPAGSSSKHAVYIFPNSARAHQPCRCWPTRW